MKTFRAVKSHPHPWLCTWQWRASSERGPAHPSLGNDILSEITLHLDECEDQAIVQVVLLGLIVDRMHHGLQLSSFISAFLPFR